MRVEMRVEMRMGIVTNHRVVVELKQSYPIVLGKVRVRYSTASM